MVTEDYDHARHVPSAAERHFKWSVSSVRSARRFVTSTLTKWRLDPTDAELAVGELAANAVLRAGSDFRVALSHSNDVLTVAVSDTSSEMPVLLAPDAFDRRGRGLLIVERLSRRWGVTVHPDGGKTVWAELHAPGSPEQATAPHTDPV